ncbi:hypothetical protein LINPERHAP1_LOCUS30140 [Linum perenne]
MKSVARGWKLLRRPLLTMVVSFSIPSKSWLIPRGESVIKINYS